MERREIRVALTETEFVALRRTLTGELESLTDHDWDSGNFDDLDRASVALNLAWIRYQRRKTRLPAS